MAMTKKERAHVEALLTEAALRRTAPVEADFVMTETPGQTPGGWKLVGERSDMPRVEFVEPNGKTRHGTGFERNAGKPLYSTRLRALRALRCAVEDECSRRLRAIDRWIEEEAQKEAE